jgi:CubicO group peptidase (beta-lactamase class C family)
MSLIDGECERRFARVKAAFAANFEAHGEVGAAVAVTLDGRPVVDLWGGYTDLSRSRAWARDTIVNVYSTSKGLTAMYAHRLADQGKLEFDAPVAKYWPEFAEAGKQNLPVQFLLSHRAGLPAIRATLEPDAIYDWPTMTAALAAERPWWEPGTRHGYHAFTFGWLVGEVVRRVSGKSLGTFFREELAAPLGLDCHIGLDAKHDAWVASIIGEPPPSPGQPDLFAEIVKNPESITARAIANPATIMRPETANSRRWRGAEIPAANGHSTARALARLYGALSRGGEVDGIRVLSPPAIERCYMEQANGPDAVLMIPTRWSLGFGLSQPPAALGPNPRSFGHSGAGGSLGYADPDARIGFGYVMSQRQNSFWVDPRAQRLIDAVYASLQE